ncbi:MAG: hypothetical protein ACK4E5_11940 [Erythrobacter cryptus]
MMSKTDTPRPISWLRKLVIPGLAGAVAGFAASYVLFSTIDGPLVGGLGTSETIAAVVGMLYGLIALAVLFGALNPQMGARFLNVEDADELREQRRAFILSGVAMALWGAALLALALAAPDGPVPQQVALVIGIVGLAGGVVVAIRLNPLLDELMRAVNLETGALTYHLVLLLVGGWALLAHLGYVAGPQPIDLLSSFYVLVLLASFVVVGKRGMIRLR